MLRSISVVVPVLVLAACGRGPSSADVAAYQSTVSELQSAVTAHQNDAESATVDACAAEHRRYDDLVRPRVHQLNGWSGGMDQCRPSGMGSMCGSMQSELDRHAQVACGPDVSANHAEAAAHCRRMSDWLARQAAGTSTMMGGGGMGEPRCTP